MALLRNNGLIGNPTLRRGLTLALGSKVVQELNNQRGNEFGEVETFTPTWSGFDTAPTGDLSYIDFGTFAIIFNASTSDITGTGNAAAMKITNIPAAIIPIDFASGFCRVVDDDGSGGVRYPGIWVYSSNAMSFGTQKVSSAPGTVLDNFTTSDSGAKGLAIGWFVMYPTA